MRIFTPGEELPVAGHPTIGTTFALARSGVIERDRASFVFGLGAGPTPVALTWTGEDLSFVWMTQGLPAFSDPIPDPARAAAALSLSAAAVAGTGHPVQIVSCAVPFLFVPLTTRRAVDSVVVNPAVLDGLLGDAKQRPHGVFVFSVEPGHRKSTIYSRMFAPDLGIVEDPATGIASGPLGCYLVRHQIVTPDRAASMVSLQGAKMGRPSYVHISIDADNNGKISGVRVGGEAALAGEGTLYL
jgi:trans-2,3-dihydro-3-hydroxyanthranilate isomerase